jgi:hypothetical protein
MTLQPTRAEDTLGLISAVAAGDAVLEDVTRALRDQGVDALDVVVIALAEVTKNSRSRRTAQRLDPQCLSHATPAEAMSRAEHALPDRPFLLRGTLYDPPDIARFNGQELHFIAGRDPSQYLAIDDRAVMEDWWRMTYISANSSYQPNKTVTAEGSGSVSVTTFGGVDAPGGGTIVVGHGNGGSSGPEGFSGLSGPPPLEPHTNFYEDVNFGGSRLRLEPGRAYDDLTEVSWTIFGTGDWNDTISSIQLVATQTAVLFEHVGRAGSTFTAVESRGDIGWFNDLASSCATW